MSFNTSLFVIIPSHLNLTKADVERALDENYFGDIKSVSDVRASVNNDKHAIIEYVRWFQCSNEILDRLSGGFIDVPTRKYGIWRATVYNKKT
jgi:hypothetical protein